MDFFFNPRGIALIGATPNPQKGGNAILKNLMTGFKGGIYPVNPNYPEIEGIQCYPSVAEVPDPVDIAIVFVPGKWVADIIRDCGRRGIRGVIIESSGFAESGEEGLAMQKEVLDIAQTAGIRLWGPNCMGLVDAVKRYVFSFVSPVIWDNLVPGNVSLVVQSGMLSGAFLIDLMTHSGAGISKVCSIGNKMDVDECELLEYFLQDPDTESIGLYLESFPKGRRFMEICKTAHKPVVVLKGGKSEKGAKAAMSHTASMAGNQGIISGGLRQAGVIEAKDFRQMVDICQALAAYPNVKNEGKGRIAVLTYSGGAGIVSADFMDASGSLAIADLSHESKEAMKTVFPEWMPVSNPVDLWPAVEQHGAEKVYGVTLEAVCADPGVDAVFLHAFTGGFSLNIDTAHVAEVARSYGKPVFCWLLGKRDDALAFENEARKYGIPVFREIQRSVECMDAVFRHKRRETTLKTAPVTDAESSGAGIIEPIVKEAEAGPLDEYESKRILAALGIPTVPEVVADSLEAAGQAAEKLGYPVVLKGIVPKMVHKTESGLVRLNIDSEAVLEKQFSALQQIMKGDGRVLIQKQISGNPELIAGFLRDPQFGPTVMFGLGGIFAEALKDAVFALAPLTYEEALALTGRIKARHLLDGFRGEKAVDRERLAKTLVKLGRLGASFDRIQEVDINPLIISGGIPTAVDASVVLG